LRWKPSFAVYCSASVQQKLADFFIDAPDFDPALRLVLRNHADVIALSDMNDPQTFSTSLEAAERNLVFCRVLAASPGEAIATTIEMYPSDEQGRIRARLAQNLAGIMSVKGLPEISGEGTAVAAEVLEWRRNCTA
jgi:Tfp pilus assembly pilus retraction ATPase PilT